MVGDVARVRERRGAYRFLVGRPEGKRPLGRLRRRWEYNSKMYPQEVGLVAWTGLIWLRMTGGGLLRMLQCISGFHEMRGISLLAQEAYMLAFYEGFLSMTLDTVELHLSGLIGTTSHPDMQKIQIIGFFIGNRLHWQLEVRLLLFTICTCV